jgi:ribosomal protein S27E
VSVGSTQNASGSTAPAIVHFPPLENGLDYLASVVEHLSGGSPSPRDLKYAVLHLQAATEVLLKARLAAEHWSLIFKEPGLATIKKRQDNNYETCTTNQLLDRLQNLVGTALTESQLQAIKNLTRSRNALQHHGLSDSAPAVESRTVEVLDFLLDFVRSQLLPTLESDPATLAEAERVRDDLETLQASLNGIRSFVDTRMKNLRKQLDPVRSRTVQCPGCMQWALVFGSEDTWVTCLFCDRSWTYDTLPDEYASAVLGYLWEPGDPSEPLVDCPECGVEMVRGASTADAPDTLVDLCFACGNTFEQCVRCGAPFTSTDTELACSACFAQLS